MPYYELLGFNNLDCTWPQYDILRYLAEPCYIIWPTRAWHTQQPWLLPALSRVLESWWPSTHRIPNSHPKKGIIQKPVSTQQQPGFKPVTDDIKLPGTQWVWLSNHKTSFPSIKNDGSLVGIVPGLNVIGCEPDLQDHWVTDVTQYFT